MQIILIDTYDKKNIWENHIEEEKLWLLVNTDEEIVEKVRQLQVSQIKLIEDTYNNPIRKLYTFEVVLKWNHQTYPIRKIEFVKKDIKTGIETIENDVRVHGERKGTTRTEGGLFLNGFLKEVLALHKIYGMHVRENIMQGIKKLEISYTEEQGHNCIRGKSNLFKRGRTGKLSR